MWSQMLLSTYAFLKSISNVSGKDIGPLIKQWVYPLSVWSPAQIWLQTVSSLNINNSNAYIITNQFQLQMISDLQYLHLFLFLTPYPEIRAVWWNSLAALPSTGRGMCWSWRSVRTTHHLEHRNTWWVQNQNQWLSLTCRQSLMKHRPHVMIIFIDPVLLTGWSHQEFKCRTTSQLFWGEQISVLKVTPTCLILICILFALSRKTYIIQISFEIWFSFSSSTKQRSGRWEHEQTASWRPRATPDRSGINLVV